MSCLEPWLDKKGLAQHFACSVRSIEFMVIDGVPHAVIFGRRKFRVSEVEAWLEQTGRLERCGQADNLSGNNKMARQRATATGP